MQLENVFEQSVRIFNCFYAVNCTTEFLFELADSFSRSNWQMANWQRIGRKLQLGGCRATLHELLFRLATCLKQLNGLSTED